ncbi:MAG: hypothetical protein MK194_14705 [Roseibacillus sp.]|nr:hypothetical protein [Roseibacillus sp.]
MDPIESWVDARELRRMADALLSSLPSEVPDPDPEDAAFNSGFIGYGVETAPSAAVGSLKPTASGEDTARHSLAAAREFAQRGGLLDPRTHSSSEGAESTAAAAELTEVTPVSSAGLSPFQPVAATPFVEQLGPFGNWLRGRVGARSYFLLDREGGVLVDEVQSSKLHQVARTLAQAAYTANRVAGTVAVGNLHIKIALGTVLEVVPVNTRHGPLILGIIVPHPLNSGHVEVAAHALQQVADAPTQS